MEHKLGKRVLLFPLPYAGHQNPMFEIGNILHSRGFSISVIHTRFNSPNPAKYPNFTFHLIDDGLSQTEAAIVKMVVVVMLLNNKCVEPFRACLSQILTGLEPVACLIVSTGLHFARAVADEFNVATVSSRGSNMTSFMMGTCPPLDLEEKEPEELIRDHPPLRYIDVAKLSTIDQSSYREFAAVRKRETMATRCFIVNSFKEIEEQSLEYFKQEFKIPVFPIGPFHKWLPQTGFSLSTEDQSCLSWLDTQSPNSVLYVSFGSVASIDKPGLLEMAWGLANSKRTFLWVVRAGLVHGSDGFGELPEEFIKEVSGRAHIVGWAPQKAVLAHPAVGGFWTHCGWNSTLESICEGVPMMCTPFIVDQFVNTRYVTEVWKMGLRLDQGFKSEDVVKAMKTLMEEKEGVEMRDRVVCLKETVNKCLLPGGSSYTYLDHLVNFIMSF